MRFLLSAGSNSHGQLASGSDADLYTFHSSSFSGHPPSELPTGTSKVLDLAAGANHTLVLLSICADGVEQPIVSLWGCGDGQSGQLGPSYNTDDAWMIFRQIDLHSQLPNQEGYQYRLIAAAWETSYVVLSHPSKPDILVSMGANDFGDLGVGTLSRKESKRPLHVIQLGHISVDGHSLDKLHYTVELACAGPHHVVITSKVIIPNGSHRFVTIGWGAARHGQLDTTSLTSKPSRQYDTPRVLSVDHASERVVSLGLGKQHTVLLRYDGRIQSLGANSKGQLEGLESLKGVSSIQCSWNGTYGCLRVDKSCRIYATGSNSHCQLGRSENDKQGSDSPSSRISFESTLPIHKIACGSEHVLLWSASPPSELHGAKSEVWGWGWNEHGNLGTGATQDVPSPIKIWPGLQDDRTLQVACVWAGCATSWILVEVEADL